MRAVLARLICLFLGLGVVRATEQEPEEWEQAIRSFRRDYRQGSVLYKVRAIEVLPPWDARSIDFILERARLLEHPVWLVRAAAATQLSRVKVPHLRTRVLAYARHPDARVREGILAALVSSRDASDAPVILAALRDEAWEVRRMACWAAGSQGLRAAVDPMLDMLDGSGGCPSPGPERHPRVRSALLYNLREITGQWFREDSAAWRTWWQVNRDRPARPAPRVRRERVGEVTFRVDDTLLHASDGPLVIVVGLCDVPAACIAPHLHQWSYARWLLVDLPSPDTVPGVEFNEYGDPLYPVTELVDALEAFRRARKLPPCFLLAQGFASWVAGRHAQRHPASVLGLVLLNPYASSFTYQRRIDDALRNDDPDARLWARTCSYELRLSNRYQETAYDYHHTSTFLHDGSDLELALLQRVGQDARREACGFAIPEFDLRGPGLDPTPVLAFFPPNDNPLSGAEHVGRLRRGYRRLKVVVNAHRGLLPYVEDPDGFGETLRRFFLRWTG